MQPIRLGAHDPRDPAVKPVCERLQERPSLFNGGATNGLAQK